MRYLVLALLFGGIAEAQVIPPGGTFDWATYSPGGSPVVFSFTAPAAGSYASLTPTVGGAVTCSRASSGTYQTGPSSIATAAANTCRVEPAGLLVEGGSTNLVLQSGDLSNAVWSKDTNIVVTANQSTAPDGTVTMALVDASTATTTATVYQQPTFTSSTGPFTASMWVKPFTANDTESIMATCGATSTNVVSTCTCSRTSGAPCAATSGIANPYTCTGYGAFAAMDRISVSFTCAAAQTTSFVVFHPGQYNSTTGKAYISEAQFEVQPFATSYIATTTTATARSADAVSATIAPVGPNFSMSTSAALNSAVYTSVRGLLALGGAYGTANDVLLYRNNGGSGALYVDVTDGAAVLKSQQSSTVPTPALHKYQASANGGALALTVDSSAPLASTAVGNGSGNASGMTTVQLGGQSGSYPLFGNISAACAGRTTGACPP